VVPHAVDEGRALGRRRHVAHRRGRGACLPVPVLLGQGPVAHGRPAGHGAVAPFGLLRGDRTIGFARVITDFAVFGTVEDVFVLPEFQGKGLGGWMLECILAHPALQGIDLIVATRKAKGFYEHFGFKPLKDKNQYMLRAGGRP